MPRFSRFSGPFVEASRHREPSHSQVCPGLVMSLTRLLPLTQYKTATPRTESNTICTAFLRSAGDASVGGVHPLPSQTHVPRKSPLLFVLLGTHRVTPRTV